MIQHENIKKVSERGENFLQSLYACTYTFFYTLKFNKRMEVFL